MPEATVGQVYQVCQEALSFGMLYPSQPKSSPSVEGACTLHLMNMIQYTHVEGARAPDAQKSIHLGGSLNTHLLYTLKL